jgi:hypothetical protein
MTRVERRDTPELQCTFYRLQGKGFERENWPPVPASTAYTAVDQPRLTPYPPVSLTSHSYQVSLVHLPKSIWGGIARAKGGRLA